MHARMQCPACGLLMLMHVRATVLVALWGWPWALWVDMLSRVVASMTRMAEMAAVSRC